MKPDDNVRKPCLRESSVVMGIQQQKKLQRCAIYNKVLSEIKFVTQLVIEIDTFHHFGNNFECEMEKEKKILLGFIMGGCELTPPVLFVILFERLHPIHSLVELQEY